MPQDSTYIKQLITKSNRIETYAGTTGVNDFKYLDGQKVSPSIPYHIMYLNDGKEVYVTGADFDENKSEVIVRYSGETDYKEYVRSKDGGNVPFYAPKPFKFKTFKTDAKKGFVNRVFVRIAANKEAVPIEIKPTAFSSVPKTYKKVKVKWKITGNTDECKKYNVNAIEKAEKEVENLTLLTIGALDGYIQDEKSKERLELEKKLDRMDIY
tara:strand:- start:828 stop:1460 length:633 start_codon:yes stop_codon:yes gene_type:complete